MKPRNLSQNALARALNVPPRRINEIVLEKRAITADTTLRLARYFGTSAEMWAGLQADYDLRLARYEMQKQIERDVEPLALERQWHKSPGPPRRHQFGEFLAAMNAQMIRLQTLYRLNYEPEFCILNGF